VKAGSEAPTLCSEKESEELPARSISLATTVCWPVTRAVGVYDQALAVAVPVMAMPSTTKCTVAFGAPVPVSAAVVALVPPEHGAAQAAQRDDRLTRAGHRPRVQKFLDASHYLWLTSHYLQLVRAIKRPLGMGRHACSCRIARARRDSPT
jgi:hypothetical protein